MSLSPRILLVEDHIGARDVLSQLLRRFGYEVDSVGTYEAARAALNCSQFQFLLSDLNLPDGDGLHLVREVKRKQDLKAIAITAHTDDYNSERAKAAGFDHYLTKPFDPNELRSLLGQGAD
jgi:CheY-like chemotaxis protein